MAGTDGQCHETPPPVQLARCAGAMNRPPAPTTVLHVIPGLGMGGAENMLATLVTAKRGNAPRAVVVDLLEGGHNAKRIRDAGIPLICLGMRHGIPDPRAVWRLAGIVRRHRPDVVQSWMYNADLAATLALRLSKRRLRARLYWGIRCSNMETGHYGYTMRLAIAGCRHLSHLADAVVANSEEGRRVHEALGYRAQRFGVIENGVDAARFRPDGAARERIRLSLGLAATDIAAIHVGRIDPQKDHATLLAALDRTQDLTMIAVGRGTEALPDRPRLIRLGERADMPDLYAAADLVVGSSAFGEGFPTALAEGMAAGLPAVATDVGDTVRVVGSCGAVVPPRDPAALACTILRVVQAKNRKEMGEAARARVAARFSVGRAVAAFDALHRDGLLPGVS